MLTSCKFSPAGAWDAGMKEFTQLNDRGCFHPIDAATLTQMERKRTMSMVVFTVKKSDGTIKTRACANGSTQREFIPAADAGSPTVATQSIFMSSMIDAHEGRHTMTLDIPNAFIQTEHPERDKDGCRFVMRMTGPMVDMMVSVAPEVYADYVVIENGKKVLYLQVDKAIYGMLQSALLFYKKWRTDLEAKGFVINPCDPCVANKMPRTYTAIAHGILHYCVAQTS